MASRVERLAGLLPQGVDCAVFTSEENQSYFLNFVSSNGTLVVGRDFSAFITDSRYITAARETCGAVVGECIQQKGAISKILGDIFTAHGVKKVLFEGTKISAHKASVLASKLEGVECDFSDKLDNLVLQSLRRCKDAQELEKIKAAQAITDDAFSHILTFIKPGVTEKQVALELDYFMLSHGASALSFETIVVAGENSAKPHGVPSDREIRTGDFVTMDFGAVVDFYHADMTRTVCVGEPSEKQRLVYNTVLEAQQAARELAGVGVPCSEVDGVARSVIANAGFGDYFGHGTGHGVGVEIHEEPCFSPSSTDICTTGDVITDEPGIYLPGEFGVRIEDMLYIADGEVVDLTHSSRELIVL